MFNRTFRLFLAAILWCAILTAPLFALPQIGNAPVTRVVLDNGLVIIVEEDHSADIVTTDIFVKAGQVKEDQVNTGITYFLQNLLLKGTTTRSADDLVQEMESVGGILDVRAGPDASECFAVTTGKHFAKGLDLLADIVKNAKLAPEEVEKMRQEILKRVESSKEDSYTTLYQIFLQHFYSLHPYRHPAIGYERTIRKITRQMILDYYQSYYVPNNMVISVVGNVSAPQATAEISQRFKDMKSKGFVPVSVFSEPVSRESQELSFYGQNKIAWILWGCAAPGVKSTDFPVMKILDVFLGSGMSSRVWLELRERRGLAYQLGSVFPKLMGPSHFLIYIATNQENAEECKKALIAEIDRFRKKGVSQEELDSAKRTVIGQYLLSAETSRSRAYESGWAEIYGFSSAYEQDFLRKVSQVTIEDVKRAAGRYLDTPLILYAR
ncbi:MAG: insulinase family protein [Armatimonadetes bacterium]|nr:insulinase family protein [Armatimonadota bacterium]